MVSETGQGDPASPSGWHSTATTEPAPAWSPSAEVLGGQVRVAPAGSLPGSGALSLSSSVQAAAEPEPEPEPGSGAAPALCFGRPAQVALAVSASRTPAAGSLFSGGGTLVLAYFFGGKGGGRFWQKGFGSWAPWAPWAPPADRAPRSLGETVSG